MEIIMEIIITLALVNPALLNDLSNPPIVLSSILAVKPAGLRVGGAARVGVAEEALHAGEDGGYVVYRGPLVLKDVQADLTVIVDVGVEHFCQEPHRGGLVGVVLGEF